MFDQACACGPGGESHDPAINDTFAKLLRINGVGIPKLTQVLFLINPMAFLPFDRNAVLPLGIGKLDKPPTNISWAEYVAEMGRIHAAFPGCQPYELNVIGYLWSSKPEFPRKGNRWYQIGTSDDEWPDFRDNNWIHQDWQGDQQPGLLHAPEPGDVVLVRSGHVKAEG